MNLILIDATNEDVEDEGWILQSQHSSTLPDRHRYAACIIYSFRRKFHHYYAISRQADNNISARRLIEFHRRSRGSRSRRNGLIQRPGICLTSSPSWALKVKRGNSPDERLPILITNLVSEAARVAKKGIPTPGEEEKGHDGTLERDGEQAEWKIR